MPPVAHDAVAFRAAFFARAAGAASLVELFGSLPHTYFFAKDRQGRFVAVNHLFLDNHGLAGESDAIGRTDRDFHPPLLAEAYIAENKPELARKAINKLNVLKDVMPEAIQVQIDKLNALIGGDDATLPPAAPVDRTPVPALR